jgi:hypothetical protein
MVHAKAMQVLKPAPLGLLVELGRRGYSYLDTAVVRGEKVASSLRNQLSEMEAIGCLKLGSPLHSERRETMNFLGKKDRMPGKADIGLITVARCQKLPLLTHDGPASVLARRCGVDVLDLVDLAALAARAGIISLEELDAAWGSLEGFSWPWPDYPWSGSLIATLKERPKLEEVLMRVMREE